MFMQSVEKNNRRSGGTSPKNTVPEGPLSMTTVLCRKLVLSNSGVSLDVLTKEEIERERKSIYKRDALTRMDCQATNRLPFCCLQTLKNKYLVKRCLLLKKLSRDTLSLVSFHHYIRYIVYGLNASLDAEKWTDFSVVEFPSKNWEETDVEISTTHCG